MILTTMCIAGIMLMTLYLFLSESRIDTRPSISDTYYGWKERGRGWIFPVVMISTSFLCQPFFLENSSEGTKFIAFLTFSSLAFVGSACAFKQDLTKTVHYTGAMIWGLGSIAWTILNTSWWCIVAGFIIGTWVLMCNIDIPTYRVDTGWRILKRIVKKYKVLWIEVVLLSTLIYDVIYVLFSNID